MRTSSYPFFAIWYGSLNLGDTPGVFTSSAYVGLMVQIPLTITFIPSGLTSFDVMLLTTDVEIFKDVNGNKFTHSVYLDWEPGQPLPSPIGLIDDIDHIPGKPEFHKLTLDVKLTQPGQHTITVIVNSKVQKGLKDDFVLQRIDMFEEVGAKVGW